MQISRFISIGQTLETSIEIANGNRFIARTNFAPTDWEFNCGACTLPGFVPSQFSTNLSNAAPFLDSAPEAMGMMLTGVIGLGTPVRRPRASANLDRGAYTPTAHMDSRTVEFSALAVARNESQLNKFLRWLSATLEVRLANQDSVFIAECDSVVMWELPACRLEGGVRVLSRPDEGVASISFSVTSVTPSIVEIRPGVTYGPDLLNGSAIVEQHYACCAVALDPTGCSPYIPPLPTNAPGCFCEPWRVHRHVVAISPDFASDQVVSVTATAGGVPYENFTDLAGNSAVHPTSNLRIAVFDPAAVPGIAINFGESGVSQSDPNAPANQWWCKALVGSALIGTIPVGSTVKLQGATGRLWLTLATGEVFNIDSQVQSVGQTSLSSAMRVPLGHERLVLVESDAYNTAPDSIYTVNVQRTTTAMADTTR